MFYNRHAILMLYIYQCDSRTKQICVYSKYLFLNLNILLVTGGEWRLRVKYSNTEKDEADKWRLRQKTKETKEEHVPSLCLRLFQCASSINLLIFSAMCFVVCTWSAICTLGCNVVKIWFTYGTHTTHISTPHMAYIWPISSPYMA